MRNVRMLSPYPTITTPSPLPTYTIGTGAYSTTLASTGGTAPYTYALTGGALPAELTLAPDGQISGTPATPDIYDFTVTVTDSATPSWSSSTAFTLEIVQPPPLVITTVELPPATANNPYSQTVVATGGITPYTNFAVTLGALPDGLTIDPITGVISGIPTTTGGPTNFTVTVTDSTLPTAATASQALSLTVNPALAFTTAAALPPATATSPYSQTIAATGGVTPYTFALSALTPLPTGMTFDTATGILAGTPEAAGGPSTLTITVTDTTTPPVTISRDFTLTVNPALAFTTAAALPPATATSPYSQTIAATGGVTPYTFALSALTPLPTGMTFDTATGILAGTPEAAGGPSTLTITVTDTTTPPVTISRDFTLTVNPALAFTTAAALPPATATSPYSQTIAATGGVTPYTFALSALTPLPTGMTFDTATGILAGTPEAAGGPSTLTITVTDTTTPPVTISRDFTLTVNPALAFTTAAALPPATATSPYSQTIAATGGVTPYTFALSALTPLPTGMTFDTATGILAGTPEAAGGPSTLTITVTDTTTPPVTISRDFTLTVNPALAFTTAAALPPATATSPYSQTIAATGGVTPYTFALSALTPLPTGMTFDTATGILAGTPEAAGGPSTLTITVTDTTTPPVTISRDFTLTVNPALAFTTAAALPPATATSPYSQTIAATGGVTPYTFALSALTPLPTGMTFDTATGILAGTPEAAGGPSTLTITVTDTTTPPVTTSRDFTLTVNPALAFTTAAALPPATATSPYSQTIAATGGVTPYTFALSALTPLPTGMTFDTATGILAGTPEAAGGPSTLTITVTDTTTPPVTISRDFTLTVNPALAFTTAAALPPATATSPYSQTIAATGGVTPYTFALSALTPLPTGMTFDTATVSWQGHRRQQADPLR